MTGTLDYSKWFNPSKTIHNFPCQVHAVCWISILTSAAMLVNFLNVDNPKYLIAGQYTFYLLCLLHMVLHPVFSVTHCDVIRKELLDLAPGWLARFVPAPENRSAGVVVDHRQNGINAVPDAWARTPPKPVADQPKSARINRNQEGN